jgi:hypothetical protein
LLKTSMKTCFRRKQPPHSIVLDPLRLSLQARHAVHSRSRRTRPQLAGRELAQQNRPWEQAASKHASDKVQAKPKRKHP